MRDPSLATMAVVAAARGVLKRRARRECSEREALEHLENLKKQLEELLKEEEQCFK